MKTGYKIGRRVAYILLAVGLVMAVVGIFMGASWHDANVSIVSSHLPSLPSKQPSAGSSYASSPASQSGIFLDESYSGVTALSFDIGQGEVIMTAGDTFSIRAGGEGKEFTSKVENGVWKIYARGFKNNSSYGKKDDQRHYTINITIPKDFVAENADIEMGMGSLSADALSAKKATIKAGMGEIDIDNLWCQNSIIDCGMGVIELGGVMTGNIKVDCGMGTVELDISGNEQDYGYTASVGMGEIEIGSVSRLAGIGGDSSSGLDRPNQLNIHCGMGTVNVDFDRD